MQLRNALLAAALLVASCSSIRTSYDYDTSVDFSQYGSFDLLAPPESSIEVSELVLRRIADALERELSAKGLSRSGEEPDLLVAIQLDSKTRVQVTDMGYSYGAYHYRYGYLGAQNVSVREYEEGTLVVDLIDRASESLVWRGTATRPLPSSSSPDETTERVNEVVNVLLEGYPPE